MSVLRPLRHEDLDALVVLQREAAVVALGHIFPQETHPFPTVEVRERWALELEDPGIRCHVVVVDGELSGFAATRGDELLHFGTALGTWGSGLAGDVHDEVVGTLRAEGYGSAWLRVFEENQRAIRFYEKRGWVAAQGRSTSLFPPHPVLCRYELVLG
ncbi:MAG: GNAT family N-acetyltransferase [Micrococcales bacterium]|nr:GNAT family N-acetyltransferase [Micrococcales bacterium]